MSAVKVTEKAYWVGALDPELKIFDVVMETQFGTSYNAYFLKGSEKTALVDSVKDGFFDVLKDNVNEVGDFEKIDYIICNHTEPDHAGAILKTIELAKNAKVVCTKAASLNIMEITNKKDIDFIIVKDGMKLDLGDLELTFYIMPLLHWPDTMFTYVESEKLLLTCDAFGFHYAAENIFDDLTEYTDDMKVSQKLYYDCIVAPFGEHVLKAINKVVELGIKFDIIAPSHGPVLRGDPMEAVTRYAAWATKEKSENKKIFVGYVSCYGYTKEVALTIAQAAKADGVEVEVADIAEIGAAAAAAKIMDSDAFAIGSPTLNRDVLKPVWDTLTSIDVINIKGKKAACFGSYGWTGEAVKYMQNRLECVGVKVLDTLQFKMKADEKDLEAAKNIGKNLLESVK